MNAIEIDGDFIGKRVTLAGKDETLRHFVIFQGIVGVHLNFTCSQVSAATGADPALATVAKIDSMAQTGVEDRFGAFRHGKSAFHAVD